MKRTIILTIILSVILFTACSDKSTGPNKNQIPSIYYNGSYYSIEELINTYNNGNLTGIIMLIKNKRNDMVMNFFDGEWHEMTFDGYETDAYAGMFKQDYSPLDVVSIVINATTLKQYTPGAYKVFDPYSPIDIFFGGNQNKYLIDSVNGFPSVIDSVSFPDEIVITNLNRYDTVSKSNDFEILWTGGGSNSKIEIDFSKNFTLLDSITHDNTGIGFRIILDNSLGYTFPSLFLRNTCELTGKYDLKVTCYTPVYKTLSNGKQILFIGVSSHRITLNLTN
ncbi:MAG: hypothetical protein N2319_02220 [Candidatus Kapabacteria bacterium]|nr:hypothetical protein [Candidatus Kapabacteria bacterium]